MLRRAQAILDYHLQAAAQSINLLCRKPLATIMTAMVIALALTLPSLFWVFSDNLSKLTLNWQRQGHISLYLKPNLSAAQERDVLKKIRETEGVAQASLKNSEEGLAELSQQEGMSDIMHYLPENPLPAVIEITSDFFIDSPAKLDLLARQLRSSEEVENVKIDMEWIRRLHVILSFVTKFADALMALLAMAVIVIVGTTLRLAVHSRQEEVQVLKLIGAKDQFIIRPFLYTGIWYGVFGAFFAVFLVNIFIFSLGSAINQLAVLYQIHFPWSGLSLRKILILLFFAIILGWIGARFSVKRQLASIEPQL